MEHSGIETLKVLSWENDTFPCSSTLIYCLSAKVDSVATSCGVLGVSAVVGVLMVLVADVSMECPGGDAWLLSVQLDVPSPSLGPVEKESEKGSSREWIFVTVSETASTDV